MTDVTLADVDRDEALTEAVAELCGCTRAQLLRGAALGSAALLGALAAPVAADAAPITDTKILNFGLRFERLQATFYTQTEELGTLKSMTAEKRVWAETLGAHERAHVKILRQVLGPKAGPRPTFDFGKATESDASFTRTLVAALFGLLTVEARHASWARHIVGSTPAPTAFDHGRTLHSVNGTLDRTRFIVAKPKVTGTTAPGFTG
jgi:hypothetical protein